MNGDGLTLRDLVLEIRSDVKDLGSRIEQVDRQGSVGTREELRDHEHRLRSIERRVYSLSGLGAVIGALAGVGAGLFGPR